MYYFYFSHNTYFYEIILQVKRVGATSNCIADDGNGGD